jgi:SET domain-containing protein
MELEIKKGAHGRGTFAVEPITRGQRILRFSGPFLRYKDTSVDTLALQIGPDLYIGASGGPDDFVNHSCDPNAGMKIQGTTAELFAIRDIAPGEEIFFDYSTIIDEDDFTMTCLCGSPGCRGKIADGKYLPEDVWKRYEGLGILPEYVRKSREKGLRR